MSNMATNCKKDNSILLQRGNTGVLLIHGITKTPRELQGLAEKLAERGFTVYCPLLPKHGTCPNKYGTCWKDMIEVTPAELEEGVEKSFLKLREKVDKVYVGGISLGANLAFHLAARYKVDGVISMGAAIFLNKGLKFLTALGPGAVKFLREKNKKNENEGVIYHNFPVSNLFLMALFPKELKKILSDITVPVLLIHSTLDNIVDPKSAGYIYRRIKSKEKRLVWVEGKGHGMADAEECLEEICRFIGENSE